VVINMANRSYDSYTTGVPRSGLWRVRFNSDWAGYDPDFGNQACFDTTTRPHGMHEMHYSVEIGLGAYSAVILSQDE
jgi:1,4-alpha-glucan branching enzyme